MILLIDNYDIFSYNLYQLIGEIDQHIKVVRNDEITIEEIKKLKPDRIDVYKRQSINNRFSNTGNRDN